MNSNLHNMSVAALAFALPGFYPEAMTEANVQPPISDLLYQQPADVELQSLPLGRLVFRQLENVNATHRKCAGTEELANEFHALVERWKAETFFHSSLTKVFAHPAYLRIIAMGTAGLALVLNELQKNPDRWFYALKLMAGTDVADGMKDAEDARAAWLQWGYKNNYI